MMDLLKRLVNSGARHTEDLAQSKKIILTNQIILLLGIATLGEAILYFVMGHSNAALVTVAAVALYVGCYIINAIGQSLIARQVTLLFFNVAIFLYASSLGKELGMQYAYFIAMLAPLVLFDRSQKSQQLFFVGLSIAGFVALEWTGFRYGYPFTLLAPYRQLFYGLTTAAIGLSILGIVYSYSSLYEETKQTLQQLLKGSGLTQREIEIVAKIIEGLSNKEIGTKLYIEESTVKIHVKSIFKKLNVKKRTELMALVLKK